MLAVYAAAVPGARAAGPLGPSDRPEAYFNGSSYLRLVKPISLKQLVGLSFRTCVGEFWLSQSALSTVDRDDGSPIKKYCKGVI